ncbi:MAG: adenine specific DNA methyltransferase [Hyphomonadaceae bacterium]|nr:MAG: adenine specific DNA methyltransferase [Hyphomonadaceae bacterium]
MVNFIVRAIDEVLQTHFNLPDGLADTSKVKIKVETQEVKDGKKVFKEQEVHKVQLLDVAAGTGTFTAEAIKQIHAKFEALGQMGMWSQYVEQDLLPRLHGFEILMASYAMCHLKIDLLLTELGYKPSNPINPPRLGVYLTNALEEYHPDANTLFGSWLAAEANEASRIKRDMPIMVAYGNPPYSVSSQNKGEFIQNLIKVYKEGLNERKINLDDDYIKFIRYAEHYIEKTGYGIVAMITNNSFYDGITHRQMRKHLMETFDHIYICDLHGSANKKETAPDGSKDQNVFDIMQGVGISIFVKDGSSRNELADIKHLDLFGNRSEKYDSLWKNSLENMDFETLDPQSPNLFFTKIDNTLLLDYNKSVSSVDLFCHYNSGIQTKRDDLTLSISADERNEKISNLLNLDEQQIRQKYNIAEDGRDWTLSSAIIDLKQNKLDETQINYRPFDNRFTVYTGVTKGFHAYPRHQTNIHFVNKKNIGLILARQTKEKVGGFVSSLPIDQKSFSAYDINSHFPLYLYPDEKGQKESVQGDLQFAPPPHFDGKANRISALPQGENGQHPSGRRPNLNLEIVAQIAAKLGLIFVPDHEIEQPENSFNPLDLLDYVYAVLHSPTYREKYKEFLKIDFPRIPYPDNADIFWQLVALGRQIRGFHLLEHPALSKFITSFPEGGDCIVEKPIYENGNVKINANQYFGNVPQTAWEFYIGGYQPAQKWLKDRKGRKLSPDDIKHYQKIIIALLNTDRLMKEIDEVWKP